MNTTTSAPNTIVMYEPTGLHGPGAGMTVLRADGTVLFIGAADARQLMAALRAAKDGTPVTWPIGKPETRLGGT